LESRTEAVTVQITVGTTTADIDLEALNAE
jgi:hypothetical protein